MRSRRFGKYTEVQVKEQVEEYAERRERKGTGTQGALLQLLKLLDIDRAIRSLQPKEHHAVLLHGQIGLTQDEAAAVLGVSQPTVHANYRKGISLMTSYLNGET